MALEALKALPFPQLVDPALDAAVYKLLRRLLPCGTYMQTGLRAARNLLAGYPKPLLIVVRTDVHGGDMEARFEQLRELATAKGVPLVHALDHRRMADACRVAPCLSIVTIMGVPDVTRDAMTTDLMAVVMLKAADAYSGYLERLSRHFTPTLALAVVPALVPV